MNIDIKRIEEIRDDLEAMGQNDVLFIEEDGKTRYAVLPIEVFDQVEDVLSMLNAPAEASVKIATSRDIDLTYDEYERIKDQILEAIEKTFMPKPEKLN